MLLPRLFDRGSMMSFYGITYQPITRTFVVSLPRRKPKLPKLVGVTHSLEDAVRIRDRALRDWQNEMKQDARLCRMADTRPSGYPIQPATAQLVEEADLGSAQSTASTTCATTEKEIQD